MTVRNFHRSAPLLRLIKHSLDELDVIARKSKESVLHQALADKSAMSEKEWGETRAKILTADNNRSIREINIDSALIGFCTGQKKYDLACSYVSYLQKHKMKLNLGGVGKYLHLLHQMHREKVRSLDEEHVYALYRQLRADYEILDTITSESAIEVLSGTKYWKECLKLLEEIKMVGVPNSLAFSCCASAAFANRDDALAWNIIDETLRNNRVILNDAYFGFLSRFSKPRKSNPEDLEVLFDLLRANDIKIEENVAEKLLEVCIHCGFDGHSTTIQSHGVCNNCNQKLQKLLVSKPEFEALKRDFFQNVIIGKNIFYKTTPAEVENFKQFTSDLGKVDVIVDGLNVAYSTGVKQPPHVLSALVAAVVRFFVEKKKTVLVLGRVHMNRWPKKNWSYVTENAEVFLTENLSSDDPYILYCALRSGLNTAIVSRDLMRGHKHLLKTPQQRSIFSRWYAQNQYQLLYVTKEGKPFFKFPLPYMKTAQEQNGTWHIPCENKDQNDSNDRWLCLRKRQ